MKKKNFAILTSGGDCSSMNIVLSTFVKRCLKENIQPYFVYNGFKGLYDGDIKKATLKDSMHIWNLPGTKIKSSRFPEFKEESIRIKAIQNLKKFEIDYLFVCGGNGSYIGAERLSNMGVKIIALPGTIDNDIASSDFTIGFDTALNSIKDDIYKIRSTMESHNFICFVEIMGRNCLDLTLDAGLCTEADYIITNANILKKEEILKIIKNIRKTNKESIVILVSELLYGIDGNPTLNQISEFVYENIKEKIRINVLGYTQRASIPTAFDLKLSSGLTNYAFDLAIKDLHGISVGNQGFNYKSTPINKANKMTIKSKKNDVEAFNKKYKI
ncbi:MAG: ATP-dependent 6-phosphofructokinase [Mycoplasmoidaceae bacterium]